jgi:hypothetical protein
MVFLKRLKVNDALVRVQARREQALNITLRFLQAMVIRFY